MKLLYLILVVTICLLAWRINNPGDLRLNRRYLARYLKDAQGNGPVKVSTRKLVVDRPSGAPEERSFYNIEAEFVDTSRRSIMAQVVYPLEELHREREKKNLPGAQETDMMQGLTNMQGSSDVGARLKEDPFKDLAVEEKVTAAKVAMVKAEVDQLRLLSTRCELFPRLIAHDEQRLITITDSVGKQRLDDVWQELDAVAKQSLLEQLVQDLAVFHSRSEDLIALVPSGPGYSEKSVREALRASLDTGLELEPIRTEDVLAAAGPLYATAQLEQGLRLVNGSPRGFYVNGKRAKRLDWAGLRRDLPAFDVIELVCDPALGLSAEQEEHYFRVYLDKLQQLTEPDTTIPTVHDLRCLAIYYQIVLVGHLAHFKRIAKAASSKSPLDVKHWPTNSLQQVADKLLVHLQADGELKELSDQLVPVLQPLLK